MKNLQTIDTTSLRTITGGAAAQSWNTNWAAKTASTATATNWNGAQAGAGWNAAWNNWNR